MMAQTLISQTYESTETIDNAIVHSGSITISAEGKVINIAEGTVTFADKTVVRFNVGSGNPVIEPSGNQPPVLSTYNLPLFLLSGFSSIVTTYIARMERSADSE